MRNQSIPKTLNIIGVSFDTKPCIVMENIEGCNLLHLLSTSGELPEEQIIDISLQIIVSLRFLHLKSKKCIHGNLKPTNILITQNNEVKLADIGFFSVK